MRKIEVAKPFRFFGIEDRRDDGIIASEDMALYTSDAIALRRLEQAVKHSITPVTLQSFDSEHTLNSKPSAPVCSLYAAENGRVVLLRLLGLELNEFPIEICLLGALRVLDLYGNRLAELPPALGLLINLQDLNVGKNCLTELPIDLILLPHIRHIGMSDNPLAPNLIDFLHQRGIITE